MRRAKTLLGVPVFSLAEGRLVGRVQDVIFDPPSGRIAGMVLKRSALAIGTRVVPVSRIRSLGSDVVTVEDGKSVRVSLWPRFVRRLPNLGTALNGLLVLTESGEQLGALEEVFVGPAGEILGYELNARLEGPQSSGKRVIPGQGILVVGRDAAIVHDSMAQLIRQPGQEAAHFEQAVSNEEERIPETVEPEVLVFEDHRPLGTPAMPYRELPGSIA